MDMDLELQDDFRIVRDETGFICGIKSLHSNPLDCDCLRMLDAALKQNYDSIQSLQLRIALDRGHVHDTEILNQVTIAFESLFDSITLCTNLQIFEFYVLQLPQHTIKYYFDHIIMNTNVVFKKLYSLSIDINEHILTFLKEYEDSYTDNVSTYQSLNLYSSFLLRHKSYLSDISVQVHLSPNHLMQISDLFDYNLQNLLAIFVWRLLGSLYLSEIQLRSFHFWCRYNLSINKLIPLLQQVIKGNCTQRLHTFSLNICYLKSNHIGCLLDSLKETCDVNMLRSFTLKALDDVNVINWYNNSLKKRVLTFSNPANKSLQSFLSHFVHLRCLSLNVAQFQLHQYNQLIQALSNPESAHLEALHLGDCCIPSCAEFGFYDDVDIWNTFAALIGNAHNMKRIEVHIKKQNVMDQFIKKKTVIVDAIYGLYHNVQKQMISIYNELQAMDYPQEIIALIVDYCYNYNHALVISIEGSPKLMDCISSIPKYIGQFHDNEIYTHSNVPPKAIRMLVNGLVVLDTQPEQKDHDESKDYNESKKLRRITFMQMMQ
eukprot:265548_1